VGAAEAVILLSFLLPLLAGAAFAAAPAPDRFADDFERGLCLGGCRGWNWASSQQIDGSLAVVAGRGGKLLRAETKARGQRVPKAALIARPAKLAPGATARIGFSLMVPQGAPLNSIHLVDLECASCGIDGNPGIRLYLRHGRLRIDRAKIGVRDAWTNDRAPQLRHGRWHRVELDVTAGFGAAGQVRVRLDGRTVLEARGDTIIRPEAGQAAGADRIQIGLTASSNAGPATAWLDDVAVTILR
jgi:hypothetical protein